MSIPPLVCNTPPPIDQCDDDKDQEDFDLRYSLSQEDDDSNEYDYNGFSSYSNFSSKHETTDVIPQINFDHTVPAVVTPNLDEAQSKEAEIINKDDVNLEDLDLKLDRVSINSDKENQGENNNNSVAERESSPNISEESTDSENAKKLAEPDSSLEEDPIDKCENDESKYIQDAEALSSNLEPIILKSNPNPNVLQDTPAEALNEYEDFNSFAISKNLPSLENDDDFDDFKFASTSIPAYDKVVENPWSGQEYGKDSQESHFEASFGDFEAAENKEPLVVSEPKTEPDDDDFDDFQCTSAQNDHMEELDKESILNTAVSDQAIERVIFSIFDNDYSNFESKFDSKLESYLGETWRHLKETDIRQPYRVTWNSSMAQNTLLKALCIDSRNILFGPKWANNMPRYAVNLGPAPLQPQKPATVPSESHNPEKPSSKTSDTNWVDPFTTDGHEFTYAEALLLDLEHLMATLDQMANNHSSNLKISELLSQHVCNAEDSPPANQPRDRPHLFPPRVEIYSAAPAIQPMRQISLPDTHIFTPSDSEIPRSKTIHYDHSPTVNFPERKPRNRPENDFSDFKDYREKDPPTAPTPEIQILEPIKIESTVPQLNWPDPGQVKETFEDFSDFISNSTWNNNQNNSSYVKESSKSDNTSPKPITNVIDNHFDDDFESFQSAIPNAASVAANHEPVVSKTEPSTQASMPENTVLNHTDLDFVFAINETKSTTFNNTSPPKMSSSSNISPQTPTITKTASKQSDIPELKPAPIVPLTPSFANQILQPISTGLNAVQSKPSTTQILQPLSLEGYSQINWPNPGMDFQDLSRFNPVEKLPSLKGDTGIVAAGSRSKTSSPAHTRAASVAATFADDDWGDFVSSKPRPPAAPNRQPFVDDDEWTDFVSSPSVKPPNGVNTISFNVHSNSNLQKISHTNKFNSHQKSVDIPTLNYITPKCNNPKVYSDQHFQNL